MLTVLRIHRANWKMQLGKRKAWIKINLKQLCEYVTNQVDAFYGKILCIIHEQLLECLSAECNKIEQHQIDHLILSMNRKSRAVKNNSGGHTLYWHQTKWFNRI